MPIMISAIAWVERGVPSANPQSIKLDPAEIKDLIDGGANDDETTDLSENETVKKATGLRGSAKAEVQADGTALEEDDKVLGPTMKGLAVHESPLMDPYITKNEDSGDEEDANDLKVNAEDNFVVTAKFEEDDATLVVYLYNASEGDFYVHHDYPVSAPVLCLEPIRYDPGDKDKKGNLLAAGTMNPHIDIWDLDIVNSVKPIVSLGRKAKTGRGKRDGSNQGHSDAVLSLSWNREVDHLLASGGADQIVVFWDMDEAKAAQNLSPFNGMVQTIEWQPQTSSVLLSGTRSGVIRIDDGRVDAPVAEWNVNGAEVEKVLWDRHNTGYVFALTNDGKLRYIDSRNAGSFVYEIQAHDEEAMALTQSTQPGLLVTSGGEEIKIWNTANGQADFVGSKGFHIGKIHSASFCPDVPGVLLLGGEARDLVHLYDIAKYPNASSVFPSLPRSAHPAPLDKDSADVEMAEI